MQYRSEPAIRCRRLALLLLLLSLASCGPSPQEPQPGTAPQPEVAGSMVLYTGARLLIGDGTVIENGAMLVRDGLIAAVGGAGQVAVPAGADLISLDGKTVMPAMIDAHAHLGYEGYHSWGADNYSRETLIEHLQRYSYYGFAAVLSAGSDPHQLALAIQRDQANGALQGARLLFAAGMGPPGQGPNDRFLEHALTVEERTGMTILTGLASAEQAHSAVSDVTASGIDFIKIWVDDRGGSQQKLSADIFRPLLEEARNQGIAVLVHQQFASDMPDLLEGGVTGFLHGRLGPELDLTLAQQVAEAGAFVVPNLGLGELRRERVADDPFLQETVPAPVIMRMQESFDQRPPAAPDPDLERQLQESMGHLLTAGVDILLGTDAGAVPDHFFGYTGHRELEIFVRLGMTPMQAVVAATSAPARRLGLADLGSLTVGKRADFVVLDASPLQDIRNTRSISRVYLGGHELDRPGLSARWRLPQPNGQ